MAETAVTAVLSKFGELASREAAVLLQVGNDVVLLRDRLEWLQAFIRDADRKRRLGIDDLKRVWVRQTRDVAFESEDVLDDFFRKVDLESQGYRGWKIWRRYITGCFTQITVRHGLSGGIKRIKDRLDQISEIHKQYKIEHTPPGTWTSSFTEVNLRDKLENHFVGFEVYLKTLTSQLEKHDHQAFISILGESGIGKSTLMSKVFNYVSDHFDVRIWFNMPPNSSTEDLLKEVYVRVLEDIKQEEKENVDSDVAEKLRNVLADKRYLLILGGISSKAMLNCVGASLPDDKKGSKVVLILEPENEEVARHADSMNSKLHAARSAISSRPTTIRLSRLDKKETGDLFRLKVSGEKQSVREKKTQEIKDKEKSYDQDVFDITGGHPLAIVVLAGLLRSKEKPVEWDTVLEQLKPGVEAQDGLGNQITGVLLSKEKPVDWDMLLQQLAPPREAKLSNRMSIERIFSTSFDDLPHDLKSCFLYFAAYPKNLSLRADQIVRMWTAEGFIKPQKDKTMEQLGHSYLKELVSRCLVEMEDINEHGEITLVRVHNRLLGFLQSEAQEASFIEVHAKNDVLAPAAVRRLSIQNDSGSYTTFSNIFPKLRSFICRVDGEEHRDSSAAMNKVDKSGLNCGAKVRGMMPSCLQDSSGGSSTNAKKCSVKSNHDLKFLCGSKFLRVISVQGLNIQELPEEIGDMIHLRYLCVKGHNLKKLPSSIGRLLNLQTLDIRGTKVKEISPKFWKIKALRHVLADELMLPKSVINGPEELQTLHGVRTSEEKWDTRNGNYPLDMLIKLRSLELHGVKADDMQALTIALEKMNLLGHLKLKGDGIPSCVFNAPRLRCLRTLVINGNVKWDEVSPDVCKLRPNLVVLEASDINNAPSEFKAKLKAKGIIRE
ncbi:hypothetical protein ACP70R_004084 [Stipagrostis hirtigluma subsp. patula]